MPYVILQGLAEPVQTFYWPPYLLPQKEKSDKQEEEEEDEESEEEEEVEEPDCPQHTVSSEHCPIGYLIDHCLFDT